MKLSEKSHGCPKRGLTGHPSGTVLPVLVPVYQPNPRSDLYSNPFSGSFMANFAEFTFHALR